MHGHDALINIRKSGRKPGIIFINDYQCKTDWFEEGDNVTICVAGDVPEMLDLRFLAGCMVSITGASKDRAKRLMEACKRGGASVVAAGIGKDITGKGWSEVWYAMD